jgi:hypothetical protein
MLLPVNKRKEADLAFSFYSVWIPRDGNAGSPPVQVRIDTSMSGFESEFAGGPSEDAVESSTEDSGGDANDSVRAESFSKQRAKD